MIDYEKPLTDKNGEPLKIAELAAHHCIRCVKKSRALRKAGYKTYGNGSMMAYGSDEYDAYFLWKNEKQFKESIRILVNEGCSVLEYNTEPDHPVIWIREVLKEMNREDVKVVVDCHDLDSIRKGIIPIPERKMFNYADGIVYVSMPIQGITNKLHSITKPNIVLYSYCNKGIIEYDEQKISERKGLVYEGGSNPPSDVKLEQMFSYRSLYGIIKKLVEMGNEVHMFCGNLGAYDTHHGTGAILYPPTPYEDMMKGLINHKYGILIFNNEDGMKDQVNYTLTNKESEYLQAGLPSLACWCPESMKHVEKHGIGFVFNHIDEIKDCSHFGYKYEEVMNNIKTKREELVMENFIVRLENLYADLLGLEKKGVPEKIKTLHKFEYGD